MNASRRPSRDAAHHSGSGWLARPSPWGTFTSYSLPAFLAHSEMGQSRHFDKIGRRYGVKFERRLTAISAVTPSGHGQTLNLAMGDRIRFLVRQDGLAVINGTTATITHIDAADAENPSISVVIGERLATFRPSDLADEHGRARLGHAYASTVYGSQGLTTDRAFVLLDPSMNRHDIYVAASRARIQTQHFLNSQACDAHLKLELPLSERRGAVIDQEMRMAWLAARLSRVHVKSCTLDPALEFAARAHAPEREQSRGYDRG